MARQGWWVGLLQEHNLGLQSPHPTQVPFTPAWTQWQVPACLS
jgi:hypothetical protein